MEQFMTPEFWIAVGQIIMIDILLGGDNAVVIALACRKLSPEHRRSGIGHRQKQTPGIAPGETTLERTYTAVDELTRP